MEGQNSFPKTGPSLPPPPISEPSSSVTVPKPVKKFTVSSSRPIKKLLTIILLLVVAGGAVYAIQKFVFKKEMISLGKPVTLTYWGLFEPPEVFVQVIAEYEKSHSGVKINYTQENLTDYRERLLATLARQSSEGKQSGGGNLRAAPDVFRFHLTWTPMFVDYLSPIPDSVFDKAAFEKTFYPSAWVVQNRGQYLGIPLGIDSLALFYNENLFRSAGKTPPSTWSQLRQTACELTARDDQGRIRTAGIAMGTTNNVDHWEDILGLMLIQNGADPTKPDLCTKESGSAVGSEEVCRGRDALAFYTIFASNQACQDEESRDVGPVWNSLMAASTYAFATEQVAMYFGPSWRVFEIKEINPGLNFKIIPVPQIENTQDKKITWATYWLEGVSKNSQHQKEAWEFLKYLSSKEVLQKLYQTQTTLRNYFGEPYPRIDMAESLIGQPYIGAFIEQASYAQSWYLVSRTGDKNGLNDRVNKYYEDAVNAVNLGKDPLQVLKPVTEGMVQVLKQYRITK